MQRVVAMLRIDKACIELAHVGAVVGGLEVDHQQAVGDAALDSIVAILAAAVDIIYIVAFLVTPHHTVGEHAITAVAIESAAITVLRGVGHNSGIDHIAITGCIDTATRVVRSIVGDQTVAHQSTANIYTTTVTGCVVAYNLAILKTGIEIVVLFPRNRYSVVRAGDIYTATTCGPVAGHHTVDKANTPSQVGTAAIGSVRRIGCITVTECQSVPLHILVHVGDIAGLVQHTVHIAAVKDCGMVFEVAEREVVILGLVAHESAIHTDRRDYLEDALAGVRSAIIDTFRHPNRADVAHRGHSLSQVDVIHGIVPRGSVASTRSLSLDINDSAILRHGCTLVGGLVAAHIHGVLLYTRIAIQIGDGIHVASIAAIDAERALLQMPVTATIGTTCTFCRSDKLRTKHPLVLRVQQVVADGVG